MTIVTPIQEFIEDLEEEGFRKIYTGAEKILLAEKSGPVIILVSVRPLGKLGVVTYLSMTDDEFEALKAFVEGGG